MKGFTLVEVISVIVILVLVMLVAIPAITDQLDDSSVALFDEQVNGIKRAAEVYYTSSGLSLRDGEGIYVTLGQLQQEGYLNYNLLNPKTSGYMANDLVIEIKNDDGINYNYIRTGVNEVSSDAVIFEGDFYEIIDAGGSVNLEINVKNRNGNEVTYDIEGDVLVDKLGSNMVKYTAIVDDVVSTFYKTFIVRDLTGPEILFTGEITLLLSSVSTYNFLSNVIAVDNVDVDVVVTVETNFSNMTGVYTITYTAIDKAGNVTTRNRLVTII